MPETKMDEQGKALTDLYEHARDEADNQVRGNWDEYWRFYEADQWPSERASYRSDIVTNFTWSNIETIRSILTDQRPNFMVLPGTSEPEDKEKADVVNAGLRFLWDLTDMDMKLPENLINSNVFGTCFFMPIFDRRGNEGLGELDVLGLHPKLVHPDPACSSTKDARFMIVESFLPVSTVQAIYGDAAKDVKADVSIEDLYSRLGANLGVVSSTLTGPESKAVGVDAAMTTYGDTKLSESGGDLVRLLRAWVRDDRELENNSGTGQRLYSTGRLVHVANGITLRDVANPYCACPVVRLVDHAQPQRFWGKGEVYQVLSLQKEINKSKAQLMDHRSLTSNPRILCDAAIYEDIKDKLTNKPAEIIPIENPEGRDLNSLIRWQVPPTIPAYVIRLIESAHRDFEIVTGIHDVTQGRAPAGVEAGVAIDILQKETKRRIGLKLRNMESALADLGKILVSGMAHFWSTKRLVNVVGELKAMDRDVFEDFKYNVKIEAGSSLPVDKAGALAEGQNLFEMGVYDEEQLLEIKDPPNKEEIAQRMSPMWALKKQALRAKLLMEANPEIVQMIEQELAMRQQQGGQQGGPPAEGGIQ